MRLHLGNRTLADQRTQSGVAVKTVTNLHLANGGRKFFGKSVINTILHVNPVGAHAGLTIVAELTDDRTLNRRIQIGVVKHDKRRITAQFHAALLDLRCCLRQQNPAHSGRARKGDFAYNRVFAKLFAHL